MKLPIILAVGIVCLPSFAHTQSSHNMTLLGNFNDPSLPSASGTRYNDVWGYTDCESREYAILGSAHYVHFFNIQNPASPQLVGQFSGGATTVWRDIDTFRDRAYSVCDNCSEGLMIFDLSDLPGTVTKTTQTTQFFSRAHTIYIDKEAGRLYASGTNTKPNGMIVLDLNADPDNPTQIGNPSLPGGYVHDIHVRNHIGYCSHGNNGYWVYNFSNPQNPVLLGTLTDYPQEGYNHSSWLSENGQYAVIADETHNKGLKTVDVSDLSDMSVTDIFRSALLAPADTASIAHNPYIRDNYAFISYYHDGVQVFNISNPTNAVKVAWYDTYPGNTNYSGFQGCWAVYPFLPSGRILASDMSNGLFILSLNNIPLDPIPHPTYPDDWILLSGGNPICQGQSVSLSVDPTASDVDWFLNNAPIPNQGNPVQVGNPGWYKAIVYDEYCAVESDSVNLQVIPLPNPTLTPLGNTTICQGGTLVLSVTPPATNVKWYRNGVLIQTGGYFLQTQLAGAYHAILFNQFCQVQTNSVQVQVIPLPSTVLTLTGDNPVCEGESATLNVDPTATNVDWYLNGVLLPIEGTQIEVTEPGFYAATVFRQFCSVQTNSVFLQVIPLPDAGITPSGNNSICEGESLTLSVDPASGSVLWYRNGMIYQSGGHQLEVYQGGTYYAILSNLFCQVQTNSVQVQVIPLPDPGISLSGDNPFCEGESVLLSADPTATDVDWYLNGVLLPAEDNPVEAEEAGWYHAVVFRQNCSVQSDSIEVQVVPLPDPVITPLGDLSICEGESIFLSADPSATAVEWYRDGILLPEGGPLLQALEEGVYSAIVYNQFCPVETNSLQVEVIPLPDPEIELLGEPSICEGGSVTLSADPEATDVEWYHNGVLLQEEGTQIEALQPGSYYAVVFNQDCSIQTETVEVQVIPFPDPGIALSGEPVFCEGESIFLSADPSATAVEWYHDGILLENNENQIEAQEEGWYSAILFNQSCAVQSDSVYIGVIPFPGPEIAISGETSFCEGGSAQLGVDPTAEVVEWYLDGQLLEGSGPQLEVQETGAYFAVLSNGSCALQTDSVDIQVLAFPGSAIALAGEASFCEGESAMLSVDPIATSAAWYQDGNLLEDDELQLEVQEGGTYYAILYNQFCQTQTDSVLIEVYPVLDTEITLSGGPSICEGDSVSLSVDPDATTIEWYLDGQLLETQAPQIETQTGGAYYAILSHPSCHIQTEPVEIEVIPYPGAGISLSGDPLICEGESLTLNADPSATAVEWRLDGELLPWEGAQIEVQEGGIYSAVVFNQFCATQADPVEVGVIPAPDTAITLIGETVICEGESVYLLAGSSSSTIGWYLDGQLLEWTGEQLEVQEGGAYYAILSNESCTVQTETVDIQVISYPDPTLSYENVLACQGDSIQLSANGALDSWQWFLDGITIETATGPEWWAAISGEYSYTGTLGPCTVSSEPVAISIVEPAVPVISFADDTLFSTPAVAYQWFLFGESIEGATGPFFVPLENGAYTVLTVDGNGCEAVSEPIEVELVNSAQARPLPQGWKVYPNPASDWLILELPGNVGGNFTLYDLTGRTKASGALFGGKTRIDTGGLKAGFYILDIRSGGKGGRAKVLLVPGN